MWCVFQALLCQGLAPRVLRVVLGNLSLSREYSVEFMKRGGLEYCHVVYWEEENLKKICVDSQPLDQKFPDAELIPLARVMCSLSDGPLPISMRGCSPLLLRELCESRDDARQFVVASTFNGEVFLQCFRQAHQDVFGMVELITLIEYIVVRMKSAMYEEWTEDKVVLRRCILKGVVAFEDLRDLVGELIELWPSIKPYIRCTGLPHAKETVDSVSLAFLKTLGVVCFTIFRAIILDGFS